MKNTPVFHCAAVMTVLIFLSLPLGAALAEVAFTPTGSPKIEGPISDVTASADGSLIFFLSPGEISVYDTKKGTVVEQFSVDGAYDSLSFADDSTSLILTSSRGKSPQTYRVEVVHEILTEGLPVMGPKDAPVTIAVFSDYQCPYCARMERFLQQVVARYPGKVRAVMKHYPLASHQYAHQASLAALAADRQGKFWSFHEALFKNHKQIDDKKIEQIAKDLGLDLDRWHKDMEDPAIEALIDRDVENGKQIGIGGTPTVFVNGKEARMDSAGDFFRQIDAEIGAKQ